MADIRSIMQTDVVSVRPDTPVAEALDALIRHRISGLPVVDEAGRVVGVVTEKDLLSLFHEDPGLHTTVGSLMTPEPRTFDVDEPLVDLVDCLLAHTYRRVFVEEKGKLVGLVSRADLMPVILESLRDRTSRPPT